jgi:hypothetical protein
LEPKKETIKDAGQARKLDDAVRAECAERGRAISISIEFANLIRPGVRKRLGSKQADKWPSQSAFKDALWRFRAAKSKRNARAMDKPDRPEASSLLHRLLNEWSDYSQAFALVDTIVKKCHEVEKTPSGWRATEKIAEAIKLLLPEFQYRVDPTLVVNLMLGTAALGRFQVNTSTPKRLFSKNRAYAARKAKEIKDAGQARKLDDAVRAECAERGRISISIEFANLIRPGVRKRLGCKQYDTWPSQSRIKGSLRRLKTGQIWKK